MQKLCDKIKESNKEEESEWLKTVYNNTSGYIHLSKTHLYNATGGNDNSQTQLKVGLKDSPITEQNMLQSIDIMIVLTKIVLWLLDSWTLTKINYH